ncbi:MAG: hypothetical protein CMH61_02910 [Nanoarchaeota archaeon]|nr:hypothetical protein [Nanoarchaeota archaeon]|tara:strand:+ start:858 stop:1253 length:396 start_codon:yes stop_codon:yes gene_type:complete
MAKRESVKLASDLADLVQTPGGHTDLRRSIVDISGKVKYFTVTGVEGIQLGNHYHESTAEEFYVVRGSLRIKLEDTRTKERAEYEVIPGQSIGMPLYVAHLVLPEPGTEFVNICEIDFDPAVDIHPYPIIW